MITKYTKGRVCVFIDAANLESSAKELGWWIDYKKLYNYLKQNTNLFSVRHYCPRFESESQDKFFTVLRRAGFKLITKSLKVIKNSNKDGKANFDVEITLDARQLMNEYDTLILFSGDSDFDYLIKFLRQNQKQTVVISTKYHISNELIANSHKYIDLKKLREIIERTDKKSPSFATGS